MCDDGVACTTDFCELTTDSCAHSPSDAACSDGLVCTGVETCDAIQGCQMGTAIVCNDGIPCTIDDCDEAAQGCIQTPNNAACTDNLACDGVEVCTVGVGCEPGTAPDCDDGLSCTSDGCSEAVGGCTHLTVDSACDDGLGCNGSETCSILGAGPSGCVAGAPVPCGSDGIACTIDKCDEATLTCKHTPDNAQCPGGQFCVPMQNGCTMGTPCTTNQQCSDGNACNGTETCTGGICKPGMPVNCNDNVDCTTDTCNTVSGACSHQTSDAFCSDGFACNGAETCNVGLGCLTGSPIVCDDGVNCTQDVCQEPTGQCSVILNDFACNDGKFCNGAEKCTATGCAAGTPVTCPSDGIACTTETCNPQVDSCVYTPNNALCGCGQTCSATQGCGNFCTVATCQGKVYQCGDCLDNDGDCKIDSQDTQCLGPCDNTENSFYGGIPGQNNSPCKSDCYFDQDTGSGNDDCYWSHKCDPLEVPPNYPPEGSQCSYDPGANIPGFGGTCSQAFQMQSTTCANYCGPLTPNGCDCFGCCAIPGAPTTVWLGSEVGNNGSCTIADVANPAKCKPCTQVQACLNTCEHCELCIGKPTLPADCNTQVCSGGAQACGQTGQAPCPSGTSCITGCCRANPT